MSVDFVALVAEARRTRRFDGLMAAIPYAGFLGLRAEFTPLGLLCTMPFSERIIGNPVLPAIHGGVTGAFLENTALVVLMAESGTPALPKTINITVEYLRSGRPVETYAAGVITRHGRRVANVRVDAWQEDRQHPIAVASAHFLLA
jgi:acyl-coenzyme A thioesterase PaaI-like protein